MFRKLTKKSGKDREGEWSKHDDKVLQAIEAGDVEKLQVALSKKGTSPIKMDPDGKVPLHEAARLGQDGCLEIMLQTGVGVGVANTLGLTPIHYTAMGGFVIPTQRLLHANASVKCKDLTDKTPLHHAVLGGHLNVAEILLDAKADIDAKEEYGKTSLMMASQQGHLEICKVLIDRGANVNAQEHLLKTCLMLACEHAHCEVVDLLLKRGARADLQDAQGFDAGYYAEASGKEEVKGHLESAPSVATWDVGGDEDEDEDEHKADAVDYIARFSNDRSDSPITVQPSQDAKTHKGEEEDKVQPNGLSREDIKEIKELEEENDVLNEELGKINMDHKRALERMAAMEQQIKQLTSGVKENSHNQEYENELLMVKAELAKEKERNLQASDELGALRARMDSIDAGITDDDDGDDADNDSWGDSDDGDLFDLPATGTSPGKVKVLRKSTSSSRSTGSDNKVIATLRSQLSVVAQENGDLKQRIESLDSELIPKSEYNDLRRTSELRITSLEDEINELKDKMEQPGEMVPFEKYDTLKRNKKRESQIMQDQLAMLADEMASTTEKLAHVTDDKDRLKNRLSRQSLILDGNTLNQQYQEILHEKAELEEAITKYTVSMSDQADELQKMHKKCQILIADKKDLQNELSQGAAVIQTKSEEYETLEKECRRLENMITKQSKAIAAQNEKARRDKKTMVDLMSEKEQLAEELHSHKKDSGMNGDVGSISKVKYDELLEENRTLQETIASQAGTLQGGQSDRDKLEFLSKENWRLQAALRKQEDSMSKKHAELKRYKKLAQVQGDKGVDGFAKHLEELDGENLKLQEELDRCKEDLRNVKEDENKFAELKCENERLRANANKTVHKLSSDSVSGGISEKKHQLILNENAKLKEQLQQENSKNKQSLENGTSSLKEVEMLRTEVESLNTKLLDTVRIYRAHLLSAIQGDIDPEVKTALLEIVKLRNNGHSVI